MKCFRNSLWVVNEIASLCVKGCFSRNWRKSELLVLS